jgi:hypothetical protein
VRSSRGCKKAAPRLYGERVGEQADPDSQPPLGVLGERTWTMPKDTPGLTVHVSKRLIEDLNDLEVHLNTNRTALVRQAVEDLVATYGVVAEDALTSPLSNDLGQGATTLAQQAASQSPF